MSAITTTALRHPNVRLPITDPKSACQEWSVMGRTGVERAQAPPPIGWSAAGTVAAYAAAIVAFAYAPVSLYWAAGGHGLLSTVGGYVEQLARQGGALPVLVALAAVVAKVAGGLLALALVRAWGRVVPRRWLLLSSVGASATERFSPPLRRSTGDDPARSPCRAPWSCTPSTAMSPSSSPMTWS